MTEALAVAIQWVLWAVKTVAMPLAALGEGILALVGATAAGAAEVWPLVALVYVGFAGYVVLGWWSA